MRTGGIGRRLHALVASGWQLPVTLLLLGAAMRLGYALVLPDFASGEIANVAIAYAETGVLADAFRPGQGPTAHVLPLPPVYAGLIYRALGVRSIAAELVLAASATLLVLASFGLLYRSFGLMGMARPWRLLALAFLCLVPINMNLEVVAFRIWEGGMAVLLSTAGLYALLRLERQGVPGWGSVACMALLAALLAFVSPPLGLALYAGCLWLLLERLPARRWPGAIVIAIAALVLVVAPWAARNAAMLGELALLRSNFGLELALGNHAGAVAAADPRRAFLDRLRAIHPFESDTAYAALQAAGGEIAYARGLGEETKAWIAAHPGAFARLSLQHLSDFFLPPSWLWHIYSDASRGSAAKAAVHAAISLAALLGGLAAAVAGWRRYRFALLVLVLPVLPYLIVQPVLRYRYIIFGLMLFFAFDLLARINHGLQEPETADRSIA